jgi:hypothetical protein
LAEKLPIDMAEILERTQMALEKRGKTWHYDFKVGGVRYRGSLKND